MRGPLDRPPSKFEQTKCDRENKLDIEFSRGEGHVSRESSCVSRGRENARILARLEAKNLFAFPFVSLVRKDVEALASKENGHARGCARRERAVWLDPSEISSLFFLFFDLTQDSQRRNHHPQTCLPG